MTFGELRNPGLSGIEEFDTLICGSPPLSYPAAVSQCALYNTLDPAYVTGRINVSAFGNLWGPRGRGRTLGFGCCSPTRVMYLTTRPVYSREIYVTVTLTAARRAGGLGTANYYSAR
jgi:hypothetical protein